MPRSIWKGAISFGLVHIPVGVVSATSSEGVDFDWLDERSMEPVGYKRVNKVTGKEISREHIVKGVQYEKGRYVVLSDEEIRSAHPKATQTIDIFSFVDSEEIPLTNIDTPYYLSPIKRGEKVYALLRETLCKTHKVALARVVIRTRQHLAAVMPLASALVMVLLRWPEEVRDLDDMGFGDAIADVDLSKKELDMARRLVDDMSAKWKPEEYQDTFTDKIMQLVEEKARAGKIENVERVDDEEERRTADIVDLTELLKRSLGGKPRDRSDIGKQTKEKQEPEAKEKPASSRRKSPGKSASKTESTASGKKTASRTKKSASATPAKSTRKTSTRKKTAGS